MIKNLIKKLPKKYKWTLHNLFSHPLMEIAFLINKPELAAKIHDSTLPEQGDSHEDN